MDCLEGAREQARGVVALARIRVGDALILGLERGNRKAVGWVRTGRTKALVERIAMKRLGTAQDITNSVVFFASKLAGFVNGQVLAVDGGK